MLGIVAVDNVAVKLLIALYRTGGILVLQSGFHSHVRPIRFLTKLSTFIMHSSRFCRLHMLSMESWAFESNGRMARSHQVQEGPSWDVIQSASGAGISPK